MRLKMRCDYPENRTRMTQILLSFPNSSLGMRLVLAPERNSPRRTDTTRKKIPAGFLKPGRFSRKSISRGTKRGWHLLNWSALITFFLRTMCTLFPTKYEPLEFPIIQIKKINVDRLEWEFCNRIAGIPVFGYVSPERLEDWKSLKFY